MSTKSSKTPGSSVAGFDAEIDEVLSQIPLSSPARRSVAKPMSSSYTVSLLPGSGTATGDTPLPIASTPSGSSSMGGGLPIASESTFSFSSDSIPPAMRASSVLAPESPRSAADAAATNAAYQSSLNAASASNLQFRVEQQRREREFAELERQHQELMSSQAQQLTVSALNAAAASATNRPSAQSFPSDLEFPLFTASSSLLPSNDTPNLSTPSAAAGAAEKFPAPPASLIQASATPGSASGADVLLLDWPSVNSLLARGGFPCVLQDSAGQPLRTAPNMLDWGQLVHVFRQVLEDYEARREMVHDNAAHADALRKDNTDLLEQMRIMQVAARERENSLVELHRRISTLAAEKAEVERQNVDVYKQFDARASNMKRQLTQAEHAIRAHEQTIEKLQERLQKDVTRQEKRREHDKEVFQQLMGRPVKPISSKDQATLEIVSAFESQRQHSEKEIEFLRNEVLTLNALLKQRDNEVTSPTRTRQSPAASKSQAGKSVGKTSSVSQSQHARDDDSFEESDGLSLERAPVAPALLEAERRTRLRAEREFAAREVEMQNEIESLKTDLDSARSNIKELEDTQINLRLEIESRPSPKDWKAAKQQIVQLQRQLSDAKSTAELRKLMGTGELIRRDRDLHELQLHRIEQLPRELCTEILQDVCRELRVTDVALILPAVHKMAKVIAAVPGMEKFIREVCSVVFALDAPPQYAQATVDNKTDARFPPSFDSNAQPAAMLSSAATSLDRVVPTLRLWLDDLRHLAALRGFRANVERALHERRANQSALEGDSQPNEAPMEMRQMVDAVRQMVGAEASVARTQQTFDSAAQHLQAHPEALTSKIVTHFQQLFDVRTIDGIFPRMTELYLTVNELSNFLKVLRSTLKLEPNAPVNTVLATFRRIIDEEETIADIRLQTSGKSMHRMGAGSSSSLSSEPKETEKERTSVRELTQTSKEIQAFFDVSQLSAVLPLCRRLVNRIRMYDEVFPQLDLLVSQLYRALRVQNLDGIMPAVNSLLAQTQVSARPAYASAPAASVQPADAYVANVAPPVHDPSLPIASTLHADAAPIAVSSYARSVDQQEVKMMSSLQ